MIRGAGAREVHMRISSPPTVGACFYGIDTPRREELIASQNSVEQIRDFIGADSLGYLSQEGLFAFAQNGARLGAGFCAACFTGEYPVPIIDEGRRRQLVLFEAGDRA
jgi:amidophosphoribosyltransferase